MGETCTHYELFVLLAELELNPWPHSDESKTVPGSSSPSPPSSSHAAGQWPEWPSGPAGRSSPPPASGTWTNPLLCHTSCARNTHTETERSAHALIRAHSRLADLQTCMAECALTEGRLDIITHWSQTCTCASRYSAQTKAHIHWSTCHISAWRALQQMLTSWDVLDIQKALLKFFFFFFPTSTSFFFSPPFPATGILNTHLSIHAHTFQTRTWTRWSLVRIGAESWGATWRVWGERCECPTGRCFRGWSAWCTPHRCPG